MQRAHKTRRRPPKRATPDVDVHSLLWKSYLPDELPPPGPVVSKPQTKAPAPTPTLPEILKKNQAKIPKPLLGIAVWNQVCRNNPDSGSRPPALDPALKTLLRNVLDLDADAAFSIRSSSVYKAFPPYPDLVILDSRYVQRHHQGKVDATLEMCVPTPSDGDHSNDKPTTFDRLKTITDPHTWSTCSLFWSRIEGLDLTNIMKKTKTNRWLKAQLRLPGETAATSVPVRLKVIEFTTHNPFNAEIRFEIPGKGPLKLCHGRIVVRKEPGRPGAARIINQKVVQFAPGLLNANALETVKYWLQAETLSLANAVLGGVAA